jgi:hypothetical protein
MAAAEFLRNESCEEAQGFLYAKPQPASEFETYLRTKGVAIPTTGDLDQVYSRSMKFERRAAKPPARRRYPGS